MRYFEMYTQAKNEYFKKLGEINTDENLSTSGRANERSKAFTKYQAAINDIAEDYNKTLANKAQSLEFHKERIRVNIIKPNSDEIAQENYLFRGFVSNLAMVNTEREFFDLVIEMAGGNEMQRRAIITNFSTLLKLGEDFVANSFEESKELNIWDEGNLLGKENKATAAILKAEISTMGSRLKQIYTKTRESLKTELDLKHEAKVKLIRDEMNELNGEIFMIQRLFKQDEPNVEMPVFKTSGQEWNDIVNAVND